jgi:hypothetical protein
MALATLFFGLFLCMLRYEAKKCEKNRSKIEERLASAGFITSRCVGHKIGFFHNAHYSLYVDDVNKKWVMTLASSKSDFMDKIRSFNELTDFIFFDEDSNNFLDKFSRFVGKVNDVSMAGLKGGCVIVASIAGLGLGASLVGATGGQRMGLGAVLGGLFGGLGASRLAEVQRSHSKDSITGAYGLILQTSDCDVNNPVLVFNFPVIESIMKSMKRVGRTTRIYKKDIKIITEMVQVLEYIQRSAA